MENNTNKDHARKMNYDDDEDEYSTSDNEQKK